MKKDFRTIWLSDIHLGTSYCRAEALSAFLKEYTCEKLYLVGDVIDGWMIKEAGLFWPHSQNQVIRRILEKSEKQNTDVIYISGNHDSFIREYADEYNLQLGNIRVLNEDYHTLLSGAVLWITHGDKYDILMKLHEALDRFGKAGKAIPYVVNKIYNAFTKRKHGQPYVSPSPFKRKLKRIVDFADRYEGLITKETKRRNCAGVVCGHVHNAQIKNLNDVIYLNCGDWVSTCSALVENYDGTIELIRFAEEVDELQNIQYNIKKVNEIVL